ncbi:MAG: hypothetical protein ACHQEM_03000 [Chitinophagales bacterium]
MKKGFYFVLLMSAFLAGRGQSPSLESTLKTYSEQYQPEKIHIHFDKDAYLPGETIWLKAYIMEGVKPSTHSKNIYFDFTDADGNLLQHNIAPVLESGANSSYSLPINFAGGAIHVKSYTKWMLNFDSSFLYNKNIPVLSSWDGSVQAKEKRQTSIQFYPEGGDLVSGLNSILAFEATDQHGHPGNIKGVVKNSADVAIDSFSTKHDGMGSFSFRPQANERYTAYWKDEFGNLFSKELPASQPAGLVLHVSPGPSNSVHFQVERSGDAADNLKSVTLVSTFHQKLVGTSTVDLKDNLQGNGNITTDQLSSGVMLVTVFDANMSPIAERAVFINNQKYSFNTQVHNDLVSFGRKGKNEITLEIPDGFEADLSVSVTDGGLGSDSTTNIVTDFLLNNDIKGNINNPAYYFTNVSDSAKFYLDLVMRTHGWRRYKWDQLVAGKLPVLLFPADNEYMVLNGQVGGSSPRFDNSDSIALLIITKDRKKNVLSLPVRTDGSFSQKGMFFYDSVQVVYKLNHASKIGSSAEINFQTSLMGSVIASTKATEPNFQWSKVPDAILEKEIDGLLAELKNYSRISTGMDYVITPHSKTDTFKNTSETAAHYLEGNFPFRFPYAPKEPDPSNETAKYASQKNGNGQSAAAAGPKPNINLTLDGNPVTLDDLKGIPMKEVLFIKIMEKSNPKDLQTLAITSRQSIYQDNIINNKTGFAVIRGYTPAKEFYVPQYSGNAEDDRTSDFRSTLYWNPRVLLDKDHKKVKLSFFNNDISNKFRVVVEGMNSEGKLTRIEQIIK